MWNDKCCKKCKYMGDTPYDLKFCVLKRIDLTNINSYCKDFEEKWW